MAEAAYAGEQHAKHPPQLDTGTFEQPKNEEVDGDFSPSPPSSSTAQSPLTPGIPRPSSASASDGRDMESGKEPASGPQRSRSTGATGGKAEKEKRKRSRVTPEQLVHLERFFAVDRSPTAARRKEISDMLGMQERQTQIWFQNRRAKAKLQDGKKGRGGSAETPPDTPPELATGYEAELHSLLHEDEPVTIIPCTDLSVGTWRRIATTVGKHDLVAYLCDTKRCLTWFIHSSGYGFKMEIPFDTIVDTEFTNAAPGSGLASFILSQPPTFFLESFTPPPPGQGPEPIRHWKKCADWTEGQQATKVLRHDLVGSAVQLAHVLRHLNAHTSGSDIRLHSPTYFSQEPSPALMEVPQPPLAALTGPGYHYREDTVDLHRPDHINISRKRSFTPPPSELGHPQQHEPTHPSISIQPPSVMMPGPHSAPFSPSYPQYPPRHTPIQPSHSPAFSDYPDTALSNHVSHPSHSSVDYGPSAPYPHHHTQPRSYSSGSIHSVHYDDGGRMLSYPGDIQPPSAGIAHTPFATPSPPLLTTPFYPPGSIPNPRGMESLDPSMPVISGMPGITYDSDDDVRRRDLQ
ncbi:hypothetical protein HYDPIDRAFT_108701 [Hydnomerulius pinastri MD-312]|nr:hypothetical protein HYDPIDRAFT_108701 [Hydnomerulius pinastri MD-312]